MCSILRLLILDPQATVQSEIAQRSIFTHDRAAGVISADLVRRRRIWVSTSSQQSNHHRKKNRNNRFFHNNVLLSVFKDVGLRFQESNTCVNAPEGGEFVAADPHETHADIAGGSPREEQRYKNSARPHAARKLKHLAIHVVAVRSNEND